MGGGRRACIFCQRSDRKITNEHVLAQWVRDLFPELTQVHHETRDLLPGGGESVRHSYSANTIDMKVNAVCEACNTVWMREMEELVAPVLGPLIPRADQARTLPLQDQALIATWLVKTGMTSEYMTPHNVLVPQTHRDWMIQNKRPPRNTFIWIAGYDRPIIDPSEGGSEEVVRFRHHAALMKLSGAVLLGQQNYELTISIGALVARVFGTTHANSIVGPLESPGQEFIPIWPPMSEQAWPAALLLDHASLDRMFSGRNDTEPDLP